jgi:hypothetical protein
MAYQEWGSGPPHFDGKNYQMWSKRMAVFLRRKGQILWDVKVDNGYVQPMNFLTLGSRDMFDAKNKAVDYLFRALCQPEFNQVHTEHLACRIWSMLKEAHVGNAQVQAQMYATYRREYENFTHLPGESIDALFQRFPYDDHDRAVKLLHSLDRTVWGGKFEAVVESEKYDTLTVNELFSKLRSAEVDRGMTAKIEGPTDSHSLTLVGGSKGKVNTNPSTGMFSLSSLMSMPDEEFNMLGEDELALLTRRFERLHENWVNMRRNTRTWFQCGKPGHFVADCLEKVENKDGYKHKSRTDGQYQSRRDHKSKHKNKHKDERRSRKKESRGKARAMVGASDVDYSSAYSTSSSSSSEDEGDRRKSRKSSKNLSGLSCFTRDGFCTMALSSDSKKSTKSDSDSDSDDEVCDELPFLRQENEWPGLLLDNPDDMLREAKKMRKELRASLEDARTRVAELET